MFSPIPFNHTLALFFFCLAGVSDFLDGRIARTRKLITNFGILMDPLADKIMTCSAFIAFVESTHQTPHPPVTVEAWMVIIIVARELAITGLRLLAASKQVVLAAERYGKHKTVSQIVAIIALLDRGRLPRMAGLAATPAHGMGAGVRGNCVVGDGRADHEFRRALSVAQPEALHERHVSQCRREEARMQKPDLEDQDCICFVMLPSFNDA